MADVADALEVVLRVARRSLPCATVWVQGQVLFYGL